MVNTKNATVNILNNLRKSKIYRRNLGVYTGNRSQKLVKQRGLIVKAVYAQQIKKRFAVSNGHKKTLSQ